MDVITMVNPFTDETPNADLAAILAEVGNNATKKTIERLFLAGQDYDSVVQAAPMLTTNEQAQRARQSVATNFSQSGGASPTINRAALPGLKAKFNKRLYVADPSDTRLQIGPLEFGSEVQGIKILEHKAVSAIEGVRTGSDFLVDSGTGDADVHVSMIFSGKDHFEKAIKPLVALFRLSPITSVKNDVIKKALYTEYSENKIEPPSVELLNDARVELEIAARKMKINAIITALGLPQGTEITFEIWQQAYQAGIIPTPRPVFDDTDSFVVSAEQQAWENFQNSITLEDLDPVNLMDLMDVKNEDVFKDGPGLTDRRVDNTGFVPMAMVGLEFQTHPELPEAIVINLYMKRVNVGNYLTEFLQYRDVENLPVPDPKDAFWLNRAIDLYIDNILPEGFVSFDNFGQVSMNYTGDNVELDRFRQSTKLKGFRIGGPASTNGTDRTEVTQLSYGIYHKFHFCRLVGEAYPTAQHMGTTSGTLRMSIQTDKIEEYERIHAYKSAADFFVRHVERFNRFNGWTVDTVFSRLLNFDPNGFGRLGFTPENTDAEEPTLKRAFYPTKVISSTDDNLPGTKHIVLEFRETNPEFFNDFGFTIAKGGYNVDILHQFFCEMWDRANEVRSTVNSSNLADVLLDEEGRYDIYAFETIFGTGDPERRIMALNPDTIIAAMLQPKVYKDGEFNFDNDLQQDIYSKLIEDSRLTGVLNTTGVGFEVLLDQIKSLGLVFSSIELTQPLAQRIVNQYFVVPEGTQVTLGNGSQTSAAAYLENLVLRIAEESGREQLYSFLLTNSDIGFTDDFKERLFASIVLRDKVPITDRLYNRNGVVKAFHTISLAMEARGEEFLSDETAEALSKSATNEEKIIVGADGRLKADGSLTTCYNDYFYITFEELFNLAGTSYEDEDNWQRFAPTFKNMGIINHDPEIFNANGFSSQSVEKAQNDLSVSASSPVPPSVFFYREDELNDFHVALDEEYSQWWDKMKSLVLEIPFDIEATARDAEGRHMGDTVLAIDTDQIATDIGDQVSTRIENMIERMQARDPQGFRDVQRDVVLHQIEYVIENSSFDDIRSVADLLDKGGLKEEFFKQVSWFDAVGKNGVVVPFVMGRTMNSPIARYERVTGVAGEAIARNIVFNDGTVDHREQAFQNLVAETVRKAASGSLTDMTVTDANLQEAQAAFSKIRSAIPDNSNDMIKAFPTMRVYLIEDRGPTLLVQDNFYGYHAIESIDITLDKYDAALAVLRIADPYHLLQGTPFSISTKSDLQDNVALPAGFNEDDRFLERIKLKQGRPIQIRGGYSADPEHLDILFTGRIAEIQPGDVVTIVAQGWKAELMGRQVEFEDHTQANSSVKDLVVLTMRDAQPKGFGDVFSGEEYQAISKVAGDLGQAEQVAQARITSRGTHFGGSGAPGLSVEIAGFTLVKNVDSGLDFRLKNVWVPDDDRDSFAFFKDAIKYGWQGSRWVVPLTPAWEVLQAATNYVWGYICQVVPFDGESTLFFGRPEQLYYHTASKRNIGKAFRKIRQTAVSEVAENWKPVINGFFDTADYRAYPQGGPGNFEGAGSIRVVNKPTNYFSSTTQLLSTDNRGTKKKFTYSAGIPDYVTYIDTGMSARSVDSGYNTAKNFDIRTAINPDLIKKNLYTNEFYSDYLAISDILGNTSVAAVMLLSSFYALSPTYVQNNVPNLENLLKVMLSRVNENDADMVQLRAIVDGWPTADDLRKSTGTSLLDQFRLKEDPTFVDELLSFVTDTESITLEEAQYMSAALNNPHNVQAFLENYYNPGKKSSKYFVDKGASEDFISALSLAWDLYDYEELTEGKTGWQFSTWLSAGKNGKEAVEGKLMRQLNQSLTSLAFYNAANTPFPTPNKVLNNARILFAAIISQYEAQQELGAQAGLFFGDAEFAACAQRLKNEDLAQRLREANKSNLKDLLIKNLWRFRAFVHYFAQYLKRSAPSSQLVQESITNLQDSLAFDHRLIHNMKVFRDYHYIRNDRDIVSNDLAASTREMYNSVAVRYPQDLETTNDVWWIPDFVEDQFNGHSDSVEVNAETTWTTWPSSEQGHVGMQFDDTVTLEDKKLAVHTDLNVTRKEQAAIVATNVLTKQMRPMYRNKLCLMGRAIKPWDYIYLNDKYTDMQGMLDVERVVHHYSAKTGWTTNVVPHAVCEANPGNRQLQAAVFASKMDRIFETIDYALWATLIIPPLASAGRAATGSAFALRNAFSQASGTATQRGAAALASSSVSAKLQLLKKAAFNDTNRLLRNYMIVEGVQYAGNFTSRLFMSNMRAGKDNLPVVFMPITFKGVPLEAGVNGSDFTYWSMGSRLHWARKHVMDGISEFFNALTGIGGPERSDNLELLETLGGLRALQNPGLNK